MEWLINKMKQDQQSLKNDYNEFVIRGGVDYNSPAAQENRDRYNQYSKAIKILNDCKD